MKITAIIFPAVIFLSVSCTHAEGNRPDKDVSITLTKVEEVVVMSTFTKGAKPIEMYNATVLSAMPDDPGIVLEIQNRNGKKFDRCAMIRPAYQSGRYVLSTLRSEQPFSTSFEIASLARQHCLVEGDYLMRVHIKQPGKVYSSNSISFLVRPNAKTGTPTN